MADIILVFHDPIGGVSQAREFATAGDAVSAAYAHFLAYPDGRAEIRNWTTDEQILSHEELRSMFGRSMREAAAGSRLN